jgi:hypothetical protein
LIGLIGGLVDSLIGLLEKGARRRDKCFRFEARPPRLARMAGVVSSFFATDNKQLTTKTALFIS